MSELQFLFNLLLTYRLIHIKDNRLKLSRCEPATDSMEEKCAFCKIIRGEESADFLYQDESLVVFKDIRPHAPVHLLKLFPFHVYLNKEAAICQNT